MNAKKGNKKARFSESLILHQEEIIHFLYFYIKHIDISCHMLLNFSFFPKSQVWDLYQSLGVSHSISPQWITVFQIPVLPSCLESLSWSSTPLPNLQGQEGPGI